MSVLSECSKIWQCLKEFSTLLRVLEKHELQLSFWTLHLDKKDMCLFCTLSKWDAVHYLEIIKEFWTGGWPLCNISHQWHLKLSVSECFRMTYLCVILTSNWPILSGLGSHDEKIRGPFQYPHYWSVCFQHVTNYNTQVPSPTLAPYAKRVFRGKWVPQFTTVSNRPCCWQ